MDFITTIWTKEHVNVMHCGQRLYLQRNNRAVALGSGPDVPRNCRSKQQSKVKAKSRTPLLATSYCQSVTVLELSYYLLGMYHHATTRVTGPPRGAASFLNHRSFPLTCCSSSELYFPKARKHAAVPELQTRRDGAR